MEYRSVHYGYGDAVAFLDRLLGCRVDVSVDSEEGFDPPAAVALVGILGRWEIPDDVAALGKDFEQAVVAFFSVAGTESEDTQSQVTTFALAQTRFLDAERLLVPGEREDSVADGGSIVIRLRGGVILDVTWNHA